jgi:tetratricopeptide (TPR) repeat protein
VEESNEMPAVCAVLLSAVLVSPPSQASQNTPASGRRVAAGEASRAQAYYLFLHARQLESDGDVQGAVTALKQAAQLQPAAGDIPAELAALYARQGQPREAIAAAEAALQVEPDTTEAHWVLGSIYAAFAQTQQPARTDTGRRSEREYASKAITHLEAVLAARGNLADAGLLLTLGRLYLGTQQNDRAIAVLGRVVEQQPDAVEGVAMLAEAYAQAGRIDEATDVLQRAAERDGSFYPALADLYERAGRWQDAADAYRKADQAGNDSPEVRKQWALALLNADRGGDAAKARDLLQEVIAADPKDTRALYMLSQAQRELRDYPAAEATARKLMAADPEAASGPFALAQVYEQQHEYRKVVETLEPVAQRGTAGTAGRGANLAPVFLHLASAYIETGQPDRAVAALDRARQIAPDDATIDVLLVEAHLAAKRYPVALSVVREAREKHPGDARLVRLEAETLRRSGAIEQGAAILEQAEKTNPDDVANYIALSELLVSGQQLERAARVMQRARAKFPDDLSVLFEMGTIYDHQKRYAEAEDAFRKVIARDARHAQALNYLGFMLADRGVRLAESVEYIRRALDLDPNNPAYIDSLGWAYFKMNRLDLAETNLRTAATQRPDESVVQDHWGDLLMRLGRRGEAVAAWRRALGGDGESIDRAAIEAKIRSATRVRR